MPPSLVAWPVLALALMATELVWAGRGRRDDADARASDVLAIATTIVALTVPIGWAVATGYAPQFVELVIGCVVAASGIALRSLAMRALDGRYRLTPQAEPDAAYLVVVGPYAIVRNPGYTGLVAAVLGLALIAGGPLGLLASVPMVGATVIRIVGEERILAAEFGREYARYRALVNWRLVPWLY